MEKNKAFYNTFKYLLGSVFLIYYRPKFKNKNVYLYQMDDFIASESAISSPELMINRIETLNSIVFDNTKKIVITNLMGLLRFLPTLDNYKNSLINIEKNMDIDKDELYMLPFYSKISKKIKV